MLAVIYARESKYEAKAGDRSPDEQVAESTAWCQANGHDIAEVIVDSGVGASRHSKGTRHGWDRAKDLIASGKADLLVTWSDSRAQRDLAAYSELRELCATHGVLWAYKGRVHDLTRGDDRFRTGLDALLAERDAEEISENVQRAMRANAAQGRPHGRPLYGYRRVYDETTRALLRVEPDPEEAPVVCRIFAAYLSGDGGQTIARALNADGIPTTSGRPWEARSVWHLLRRPGYAGLRTHRGEIIGGAMWPPLIDRATWERVQARQHARRDTRQRAGARLLTGLLRCSVCGDRMHQQAKATGRGRRYGCVNFHVARDATRLERWVTVQLLDRLARPDVAELLDGTEHPEVAAARAEIVALRGELDEAMGLWRARRLSPTSFADMESDLLARIRVAERTARRAMVPIDMDLPDDPAAIPGWWLGLGLERQREVLAAWVAAVVVKPVGSRWYVDRHVTEISWR